MSRFDYIAYDKASATSQARFKETFKVIENMVETELHPGRAKALVFTKLEECYMWIGKAIRDQQCAYRGDAELKEGRGPD